MSDQNGKDTFSQRLNRVLDDAGFPPKGKGRQTELARLVSQLTGEKISQKGVRRWLEVETHPRPSKARALCKEFGVSYDWLMTGRGNMRAGEEGDAKGGTATESGFVSQIARLIPKATPRSKEALLAIARAAEEGKLTDEDLELLQKIAERFEGR